MLNTSVCTYFMLNNISECACFLLRMLVVAKELLLTVKSAYRSARSHTEDKQCSIPVPMLGLEVQIACSFCKSSSNMCMLVLQS